MEDTDLDMLGEVTMQRLTSALSHLEPRRFGGLGEDRSPEVDLGGEILRRLPIGEHRRVVDAMHRCERFHRTAQHIGARDPDEHRIRISNLVRLTV